MKYFLITIIIITIGLTFSEPYTKTDDGYLIGDLDDPKNKDIKGRIFFVDNKRVFIKKFKYTYPAPDMYFWLDKGTFSHNGLKVPSPIEGEKKLESNYLGDKNVTLTLPAGKSLKDFDVFGLYCFTYSQNFGQVRYDKERLPF